MLSNSGRENIPDPSEKLMQSEAQSRELAKLLQAQCPPNWGFLFAMFDFVGPEMTWICNAEREGAIKMIEELAAKLKEGKAGSITEPDPDLKIRRLKAMLSTLTDEERHELFGNWCRGCGGKTPCTCMKDE